MAISKITTSGVSADTLTAADLAPNSVDSSELVDGSVDLSHMSVNSVDSDQYVDGSIDTAHIADNQITLAKMAGGTDGNLITYDTSGDPAYVATGTSGHVLTSAGAGAVPAFAALPAGGITHYDEWALDTSVNPGNNDTFMEDFTRLTTASFGAAMTLSGSVFTFPATGYWKITMQFRWSATAYSRYNLNYCMSTTNNSSYVTLFFIDQGIPAIPSSAQYATNCGSHLFDVTSTTNCKVKFYCNSQGSNTCQAQAENNAALTFMRIGDT